MMLQCKNYYLLIYKESVFKIFHKISFENIFYEIENYAD